MSTPSAGALRAAKAWLRDDIDRAMLNALGHTIDRETNLTGLVEAAKKIVEMDVKDGHIVKHCHYYLIQALRDELTKAGAQ